jgi:ubiquinone biosynthesis protein
MRGRPSRVADAARARRRRLLEIAATIARHSLGYVAALLRLDRVVPFHRGMLGHARRERPYTRAEHVRLALEELGAGATKLGQILSTRGDLLPPAYQAEFSKLQDAAPPEPFIAIRAVLTMELERPLDEVFSLFDPVPIAAASIGQAHAATLRDGADVVVKVRRPGVVQQIELDLAILEHVVTVASRHLAAARRQDLAGLVREFSHSLHTELDYLHEAAHAERFAHNFAGDTRVRIPRIYREETTARVVTLERLRGLKIDDVDGLDAAGVDRRALARRAADILLTMIFEHGFFHADPHPGNLFVEADGRIGIIDFGMVGTVDPATQSGLAAVLVSLAMHDSGSLADALCTLGVTTGPLDPSGLRRDLDRLLNDQLSRPLGELALGPLLHEVLAVARRHRLRLPATLALLAKTLAMCEGITAQVDPSFQMTTILAPYVQRLMVGLPSTSPEA